MQTLLHAVQAAWEHREEIRQGLQEQVVSLAEQRSGLSRYDDLFPHWAGGYSAGWVTGTVAEAVGVGLLSGGVAWVSRLAKARYLPQFLSALRRMPAGFRRLVLGLADTLPEADAHKLVRFADEVAVSGEVVRSARAADLSHDALMHIVHAALDDRSFFDQLPGFAAWFRRALQQELEITGHQVKGKLTLNLEGLVQASMEFKGEDRKRRLASHASNLAGHYTEALAREAALRDGRRIVVDISHVNQPGLDLVTEKNGVYRITDAKAYTTRLGKDAVDKYIDWQDGRPVLKIDRLKLDFEQQAPRVERQRFRDALAEGRVELEFYVNSPLGQPLAEALKSINGQAVDGGVRVFFTVVHR